MQTSVLNYRVEWLDETGTKRYKFYNDVYHAEKAVNWLIKSGATNVYLVAIVDQPENEPTDKERDKQFGLA